MVYGLTSSHLGSSRLCGDSASLQKSRLLSRRVTADSLLAHGPRGGPSSPQGVRHGQIMQREAYLQNAAECLQESPKALHQVLMQEASSGTPAEIFAESRLGQVLVNRVKHKFLETALADPRSPQRSERLTHLKAELHQTRPLGGRLSPEMQDQLRQLEVDAEALDAISRAQALQNEAHANATAYAEIEFRGAHAEQESRAGSKDSKATSKRPSLATPLATPHVAYGLLTNGLPLAAGPPSNPCSTGTFCADAAMERARNKSYEREMELDEQRNKLVKEAMDMLKAWKSHSQVAFALSDALLSMAEVGGRHALEEMERQGLGVLASTVADLHRDRSEVARCALRLLSSVSIELLLMTIQENPRSASIVGLGLESLNRRVKNDDVKLDELAKHGGRELMDTLEADWKDSKMISLHIVNLRRRLRRSTIKSIKAIHKVQLPPDDVVKLRETFDAVDVEKTGAIGKEQLGQAMGMLRIQISENDLSQAIEEIDLDGSGLIEWPEFLFLMARFGSNFSTENCFSQERLEEMRATFDAFDTDHSGTLDADELKEAMKTIGLAPEDWEIRAMIAEVDDDKSGAIDWSEFLYLMSKKTVNAENEQRLAFEFFMEPRDPSGRIKKERFVSQMQKLTSEFSKADLEAMVVQAKCEDHDTSYMTYKEFVKMMMTR